jgi:hypothetical protein
MGHPRRAEAAPSPVQLLAIFQAKEKGIPVEEISRRTKYAVSSVLRWYDKWGKDVAFFEAVSCEIPELANEHSFDRLFPDRERQQLLELEGPVEISETLSRPLINYGQFSDSEPFRGPDDLFRALGMADSKITDAIVLPGKSGSPLISGDE